MKRYQEYMEQVEVSRDLHERLTGLSAPRQGVPWKKYGAIAAALVLAVGLGAFGLWDGLGRETEMSRPGTAEIDPDIATLPPGETPDPGWGDQTDGGYEVTEGETVAYYLLPAIVYNEGVDAAVDYSLAPPGALSRAAGWPDAEALLGGADMAVHLLWDKGLTWSGTVWFLEDGSPCSAFLWAEGEDLQFSVELLKGEKVPSCVVYPEEHYETTTFQGVEITAVKDGGWAVLDNGRELREKRELSFLTGGLGCKLTIYGVDGARAEEMCARFARWAIAEGFDLSALSFDGAQAIDFDGKLNEPGDEGGADTPAYDPAAPQD